MRTVAAVVFCLSVLASVPGAAVAQPGPPVGDVPGLTCMPYPGVSSTLPDCPPGTQPPCPTYNPICLYFPISTGTAIRSYDFANAFLGVPGLEWTFVTVKNKTDVAATAVIEVTVTGRAPIRKDYPLAPQERPEPINLGTWTELKGMAGGISIIVYANQDMAVSVAMHPRITNANDPAQITAFWREAKLLEGR